MISVGNISFGGTEKTPLCEHLLSFLERKGLKPAYISRGYKGKWEKMGGVLSEGRVLLGNWRDSGDEPFMVAKNNPGVGVFVGKKRFVSCLKAKALGFNIAILDDGFQHLKLSRHLDIVLYSPSKKLPLRECPSSLRRADIVLVKGDMASQLKTSLKSSLTPVSIFRYSVVPAGFKRVGFSKTISAQELQKMRSIGFCGIAHPERFLSTLLSQGIKIMFLFKFPDHYSYPPSSISKIIAKYKELKAEAIITTKKDALKIEENEALKEIPTYFLQIELSLEEGFYQRIDSFLKEKNLIEP